MAYFGQSKEEIESEHLKNRQILIDNDLAKIKKEKTEELLDKAEDLDSKHPLIPFLTTTLLWQKSQIEEGYEESYIKLKQN